MLHYVDSLFVYINITVWIYLYNPCVNIHVCVGNKVTCYYTYLGTFYVTIANVVKVS